MVELRIAIHSFLAGACVVLGFYFVSEKERSDAVFFFACAFINGACAVLLLLPK